MIDQENYLLELDKLAFPTVNYHQEIGYGLSSVNFFALAMGLFMFAAPMMGWIGYESPTLGTAFMFGGICEYLIGFYDWYRGSTMLSFVDFIFGILHLVYYYVADIAKYQPINAPYYCSYMQGVFYCLWFAILLFVIISLKGRGCMYIIYMFILALATVFMIIWEFSQNEWPRKAAGYCIFIATIFIWYTGLGRLMNSIYYCDKAPLIYPYW
jgi:succinate-acetate transporter protein